MASGSGVGAVQVMGMRKACTMAPRTESRHPGSVITSATVRRSDRKDRRHGRHIYCASLAGGVVRRPGVAYGECGEALPIPHQGR